MSRSTLCSAGGLFTMHYFLPNPFSHEMTKRQQDVASTFPFLSSPARNPSCGFPRPKQLGEQLHGANTLCPAWARQGGWCCAHDADVTHMACVTYLIYHGSVMDIYQSRGFLLFQSILSWEKQSVGRAQRMMFPFFPSTSEHALSHFTLQRHANSTESHSFLPLWTFSSLPAGSLSPEV